MKTTNLIIALLLVTATSLCAQDVNYRALDNTKHIVSAHFNIDYGTYYGLSYGYVWRNKLTPIIIGTEFTVPFGNTLIDDWKWKTSVQAEVFNKNSFSVVVIPAFLWKHFESPLVTMQNFGADVTINFGYVKPTWGIVGIAGFDKYIATRVKNGLLRDYYPDIHDGWYDQSGGNFKFALRLQKSFATWNSFLTVGKHFGQDFEDNPTMPFFAEFSVQKRF